MIWMPISLEALHDALLLLLAQLLVVDPVGEVDALRAPSPRSRPCGRASQVTERTSPPTPVVFWP